MNDSQIRAKRMILLQKHFQSKFVENLMSLPGVLDAFLVTDDAALKIGIDDGLNTKVDSISVDYSDGKEGLFAPEVIEWFLKVFKNFGVEKDLWIRFRFFRSKTNSVTSTFPEMWIQLRVMLDENLISSILRLEPSPHIRVPGRNATLRFLNPEDSDLEAHIVDDEYWNIKNGNK